LNENINEKRLCPMQWLATSALILAISIPAGQAIAQTIVTQELRIPAKGAGSKGLDALMVRPNEPGPHPLALFTHGTPREPGDRSGMTPFGLQPQAMEFARRGWTVVVVLRRGFGDSGGRYDEESHSCANPDYVGATKESVIDLRAAVAYLSTLPEIDASRIISVGISTGGLAMVGLTADPPPGLLAAISFAGGRGSRAPDMVCSPDALVDAFAIFGKKSRIPMLWVYSQNDHFFGPQLAQRFHQAFTRAGGNATFILAPPFSNDGHHLFSRSGVSIWAPMVDRFLQSQNLTLRASLLPLPEPPNIEPPSGLPDRARAEFRNYLTLPPHKALATSEEGHYGVSFGRRTDKDAENKALDNCKEAAPKKDRCKIAMLDDAPTP
jgi:dienelactone hydrolase